MDKNSFVFYKDWYLALREFDDTVRLEIYDAIMHEVFEDDDIELSNEANIAMRFISPSIKRDSDKYNLICERRKAYGSKGGVAKASKSQHKVAKGGKRWQKVASVADNDNDNDNDNDIQDTNVSMSINKEEDTDVSKKKSSVFVPPSVGEVAEYIKQKGYHFDAQSFVDYYEADDWHYGKGANRKKVTSWKRCCPTWNKKNVKTSSDLFNEEEYHPKVLVIDGQVYR